MESNTHPDPPSMQAATHSDGGKTSGAPERNILAALQLTERSGKPQEHVHLDAPLKIDVKRTSFYYGETQALFDISLPIRERQVTALIGETVEQSLRYDCHCDA